MKFVLTHRLLMQYDISRYNSCMCIGLEDWSQFIVSLSFKMYMVKLNLSNCITLTDWPANMKIYSKYENICQALILLTLSIGKDQRQSQIHKHTCTLDSDNMSLLAMDSLMKASG